MHVRINTLILNSKVRWFEILWLGEKPDRYCSYLLASSSGEMMLEQFYLLDEYRGKGLDELMLCHVDADARKKNVRLLMLQANKRNKDPISLFLKASFQVRGEATIDNGNGCFMDDFEMEKVFLQ